jgi:calcineurin-like phosphoesterase family protein
MDYFTSDQHFGHTNIIGYCNRPFTTIEEHDTVLIENWNKVIKTNRNKVFVVGDFSFNKKYEKIKELTDKLLGYKILILGNHDRSISINNWRKLGFNEVYKYPIIYKQFYIVSHEPMFMNATMPYINIHGHIHQNKMEEKYYYNVSVEYHNYSPVSFDQIVKEIQNV